MSLLIVNDSILLFSHLWLLPKPPLSIATHLRPHRRDRLLSCSGTYWRLVDIAFFLVGQSRDPVHSILLSNRPSYSFNATHISWHRSNWPLRPADSPHTTSRSHLCAIAYVCGKDGIKPTITWSLRHPIHLHRLDLVLTTPWISDRLVGSCIDLSRYINQTLSTLLHLPSHVCRGSRTPQQAIGSDRPKDRQHHMASIM
jgi:hypothetical protein